MNEHIIEIGKHVIETLTTGMYSDSKYIYREYIQNAADQIDIAVKKGLVTPREAEIHIDIDHQERSICIWDNATGIQESRVISILGNIALSEKDQKRSKGFRGIGRLGGLGYCKTLRYETSYQGEAVKSIMTWDAERLRNQLRDPSIKMNAAALIQSVISTETASCDIDEHFFQVTLDSISEDNNELLDIDSVREYLEMVAPVPYHEHFYFKQKIYQHIDESNYPKLDEYRIFLNKDLLFKTYRKNIYQIKGTNDTNKQVCDRIHDVAFKEFRLSNNEIAAWMWFGVMNYESQINERGNPQRGLRVRCKNIQIGDGSTLVRLFREQRGNYYFVGEIHAIHHDLIPNARRDYFEENSALRGLENLLREYFADVLHKLYHDANDYKNILKKERQLQELQEKLVGKRQNGELSGDTEEAHLTSEIEKTRKDLEKKQKKKTRLEKKAEKDSATRTVLEGIKEHHQPEPSPEDAPIEEHHVKKKHLVDKLAKLKKGERKVVRRIFEVINKELPRDQAEELIQKIFDELV